MNKRIRKKILKRTNLKRQEAILNEVKKHFSINWSKFGGWYFVFSMGDHAICHFTLKETPKWKYGIWLGKEDSFQIFGEHIDLIDKFKPSATYVSYENDLNDFIETVKEIAKNPKLYFVDSYTGGEALIAYEQVGEDDDIWFNGYQVVREFNEKTQLWDKIRRDETITQEDFVEKHYKEFYESKAQDEREEEEERLYAFNFFKKLPSMFDEIVAVGIIDCNRSGCKCSPRYDIRVVVDINSQEEMDNIFNKLNDLIWDKNRSEERKTHSHRFDLFGCYDHLSDIKKCDYVYPK